MIELELNNNLTVKTVCQENIVLEEMKIQMVPVLLEDIVEQMQSQVHRQEVLQTLEFVQ